MSSYIYTRLTNRKKSAGIMLTAFDTIY